MTMEPEKLAGEFQVGRTAIRYLYWQDDDFWIGYLEAFPDYWTQGTSRDDLEVHLRDLQDELSHGPLAPGKAAARKLARLGGSAPDLRPIPRRRSEPSPG